MLLLTVPTPPTHLAPRAQRSFAKAFERAAAAGAILVDGNNVRAAAGFRMAPLDVMDIGAGSLSEPTAARERGRRARGGRGAARQPAALGASGAAAVGVGRLAAASPQHVAVR